LGTYDSTVAIESGEFFTEGFSLEIGDSSFNDLDLEITTFVHFGDVSGSPLPDLPSFSGSWSATDVFPEML